MAEQETEGLEELDSLLEDTGGQGEESSGFAEELDDFLSDDAPAEAAGGGEEEEAATAGDSELDSFFEDLSTIDDLEVIQDQEAPPAAAEPEVVPVAAPAAAEALPPAAPARARRERKPRPWLRRIAVLIVLGALAGGVYWLFPLAAWQEKALEIWATYTTSEEEPVTAEPDAPPPEPLFREPPPPPPQPVVATPPSPPPPAGQGFGVQVATCVFTPCVEGFRALLKKNNRSIFIREKVSRNEVLEIVTRTTFTTRQGAQEVMERINREHRLEGRAFLQREGGVYKISMGTFPDLERANLVRDALNQQFPGQANFTTHLKTVPNRLRRIVTGRFPDREQARQELRRLKKLDSRFQGAFLVRN